MLVLYGMESPSRPIGFLNMPKLRTLLRDLLLLSPILDTVTQFGETVVQPKRTFSKRVAKLITNSCFDASARQLLNTLGLKPVQDLIHTEINTLVYKTLNGLAPEYLSDERIYGKFRESFAASSQYKYRFTTFKKTSKNEKMRANNVTISSAKLISSSHSSSSQVEKV